MHCECTLTPHFIEHTQHSHGRRQLTTNVRSPTTSRAFPTPRPRTRASSHTHAHTCAHDATNARTRECTPHIWSYYDRTYLFNKRLIESVSSIATVDFSTTISQHDLPGTPRSPPPSFSPFPCPHSRESPATSLRPPHTQST